MENMRNVASVYTSCRRRGVVILLVFNGLRRRTPNTVAAVQTVPNEKASGSSLFT